MTRDEQFELNALTAAREQAMNHPAVLAAKAQVEQQAAAANTERAFQTVFQTVVPGKTPMLAMDNQANRAEIISWLHPGEQVGDPRAWFLKVLEETPSLKNRLAWKPYLTAAQQKQQQAEGQKRLRERFDLACKTHGLDPSQANFNLWSSVPDPVISVFNGQVCILLESGETLNLVPATQEQKDRWRTDFEQKKFNDHQEHLRDLEAKNDITSLRKITAEESSQRQLTAFERNRNYSMLKNFITRGENMKEPLPEFYRGQKLTADTIKRGGVEVIKELGKRCGLERLNCLLHNLPVEEFFTDAEPKLKALAESFGEVSFTR